MSAASWKSCDGRVQRTIVTHGQQLREPGQRPRAVCDDDTCMLQVSDLTGTNIDGWLSSVCGDQGDHCVQVRIGSFVSWLDRLLEQCLLTLCVGDCATAQFWRHAPAAAAAGGGGGTPSCVTPDAATVTCRITVTSAAGGCDVERQSVRRLLAAAEASGRLAGQLYGGKGGVSATKHADDRSDRGGVSELAEAAFYQYRRCLQLLLYAEQRLLSGECGAKPAECADDDQQQEEEECAETAEVASVTPEQMTARLTVCRANLAACLAQAGHHCRTVQAAALVLSVQPDHVRCLYRRAAAQLQLQQLPQAERDINQLLQLEPKNTAALKLLQQLKQQQLKAQIHTSDFMRKYFDSLS